MTYKEVGNAGFAGAKTCQSPVKPVACTINSRPTDLSRIIDFLDNIKDLQKTYGSFEKAEQAVKELVVE